MLDVGPDATVLKKIRSFPDGSKGSWMSYLNVSQSCFIWTLALKSHFCR